MDNIVPPEVTAELTQLLSNLVLGDNEIRSNAEKGVNERLAQTPEVYILALAQYAITADTDVMRSFALVLLRRLLFRPSPSQHNHSAAPQPPGPRLTLYDALSAPTLASLERLLLHSLLSDPSEGVRRKTVDTTCDLANHAMQRGRPWHALQAQAFSMSSNTSSAGQREAAFRIFNGAPLLVMDLSTEAVCAVLKGGLEDAESLDVRLAALKASATYLAQSDAHQLAHALALMYPMLDTLPSLPAARFPGFIGALTPLASTNPGLFAPHLRALLGFLPGLILPSADPGPTPTVAKPYAGAGAAARSHFAFPPPAHLTGGALSGSPINGHGNGKGGIGDDEDDNADADADAEKEEVRKSALEFMLSLSEAKPGMVKKVDGWAGAVVRACLEGMGEIADDELDVWLEADPAEDPTADTYPHAYESSLDRLACALGGRAVLPPAFQYIPSMLASYDWRLRHAGLMAVGAIGEGTSKVMVHELGKVVELVLPMFGDAHPRVRYAACQCVGQLCTDLEEVIQEQYGANLFSVLIPTLEAPEPRVHAHAAAALINFCEGVERDTLLPYLDPIVERLLKLLNPAGDGDAQPKRYVQEQAITTLAMVADASEATFAQHYASIMPLLLNVLRNASGPEYRKLRVKTMECAGLIAIAVGRDVFRPDSGTLVELLMRIQNSPVDPGDTLLNHYLIATWAKICQALGPEFEPYLPVVMPPLVSAASAKADISVYEEDEARVEEREGWETLELDGQTVGIRTSAIEEKCQAFETLVIYCSTLGGRFAPYLSQSLELTLPSLRFYFHDGVREACAMLIPMLLSCGKTSNTLTPQMVSATFHQLINCIGSEQDPSFLASLFKCFADSLRVMGGPASLTPEFATGIIEATKRQLQTLADKRKNRTQRPASEIADTKEDMALLEEIEDFALEDMAKLLFYLDPEHPLLIAVSSVKDMGFNRTDSDDEEGGEEQEE
ncbi:ARM repeat-containing protein [Athelia psychrophila]|uniref:ARM repeat-containing protein n=1 Tax=Athelia psychrophila TaxID=1759441 RepID=A0A165YF46_9AGAM|nr:ARM repeat-containing protein [Fibularhizoctonia sp. CBS 109695]